ncbi:MAG: hypothetical protein GY765_28830 [bacterium]|nr:hypothetical protein [bacterium]
MQKVFVKSVVFVILLLPILMFSQDFNKIKGDYLGQKPPGITPEVFALGIVGLKEQYVQDVAFSTDGKEMCFVLTNKYWNEFTVMYMKQKKDTSWTKPVKAPFLGDFKGALRASFSPDGKKVYFITTQPRNIWASKRTADGWAAPEKMAAPINSDKIENSFAHLADNTLVFCSHREGGKGGCDVYVSEMTATGFSPAKNIEITNTGSNDCGPVISPDGKYLVFHSNRPNGHGGADLYVSAKTKACGNKWCQPVNLGPGVNTKGFEIIAHFSPDGKYLFYTGRAAPQTLEPSKVLWVSTKVLEETLKKE